MSKYDLIIVLATQPDVTTWDFPKQVYDCLDRAKELLEEGRSPYIALSGNRSVSIDNRGLHQPFRECDAMADYLLRKGVPENKILKEGDSKDTPSNLYFLKTEILIPRNLKHVLFVVAEFRIPRLKFLCKRILGPEYTFEFEPIECEVGPSYNEPDTWKVQAEFLAPMKDGEHAYLADKFYNAPMYQDIARRDKEKYHVK